MLEQEFENAKITLLGKLEEYLKSKGINTESSFNCLNPNDYSHLPSMNYNKEKQTVDCFNCKASYNIFDLIGIDYNLPTFLKQFIKAHELFLGKVPLGYIDVIKRQYPTPEEANTPKAPIFEFENDNNIQLPFGQNDSNYYAKPSDTKINHDLREESFNNISPFDEVNSPNFEINKPTNTQNLNFGATNAEEFKLHNPIPKFGQKFNIPANSVSQPNFAENSVNSPNATDNTGFELSRYIASCARDVNKTTYFKDRGLSEEVISRFNLGYDEHFSAEIDNISGQTIFWKAAIIPYGNQAYCVRNTDLNANSKNERYKKKGIFDIYNIGVLSEEGDIFVAEGEFDALSLETLGYRALALGGVGNVRLLVDRIQSSKIKHHYYICLDNDTAGQEAAISLSSYLEQLNIPYTCINVSYPYKDINECLYTDRKLLEGRLKNLNNFLSYQFEDINEKSKEFNFINNSLELDTLPLSSALYGFTAEPNILKSFVSQIIRAKSCSIIYAATKGQCNNLSQRILKNSLQFKAQEWGLVKFLNVKEDLVKTVFDSIDAQIIRGNTNFVVIADLSSYTDELACKALHEISSNLGEYCVPIIALCNRSIQNLADSLCLQNINISINPRGDFECSTQDKNFTPISFVKPRLV